MLPAQRLPGRLGLQAGARAPARARPPEAGAEAGPEARVLDAPDLRSWRRPRLLQQKISVLRKARRGRDEVRGASRDAPIVPLRPARAPACPRTLGRVRAAIQRGEGP